ncbi:hypothetical protein BaRGS_00010748 [Batillaria attramentaria]|uniref:Uncharacterized protein n=1 Tax=Batillaria attramentaria TaxID=370345 RepID=A0ABD0LFM9_9CAEN
MNGTLGDTQQSLIALFSQLSSLIERQGFFCSFADKCPGAVREEDELGHAAGRRLGGGGKVGGGGNGGCMKARLGRRQQDTGTTSTAYNC